MKIAITAIGTANPVYKRNQSEIAELISAGLYFKPSEKRLLRSIYKATGIEYRHSVLSDYSKMPGQFEFFPNDPDSLFPTTSARMKVYKDNALQLALAAIENCKLNFAHVDMNQITHLITVSCTGMYAPGIDIEIVQQLKLKSSTKRTAINFMGCYGVFNALKIAEAICQSEINAKVMIVCVELCSIHFQKNKSMDHIISNAIFADGAAVALIESQTNAVKYLSLEHFYCELLPQSNQEMAWHIADSGFDIVLSSYVPELIKSGISTFTHTMLNQLSMHFADIDFFAIHPGGIKILQACEEALGLSYEDNRYAYHVLKNYGNMSAATILFVLKELLNDITPQDNHKNIFSCAFGPGLTLESMILKAHYV
jgi:predicted naringenin-chalcone synthase